MPIEKTESGTTITGESVRAYQALAIAKGLMLYANTGVKPNTAWTSAKMLATAGKLTGKTYKRGQHRQAARDLEAWAAAVVEADKCT